jgi:hypothetical protein
MRSGIQELLVQRVAEAASFIDGVDAMPASDFLPHPFEELDVGKLLRGSNRALITLDGRDDVAKIHVQAELENVELGVEGIFRTVKVLPMSMKVLGIHNSECAPVLLTLINPSWHLTAAASGFCIFIQIHACGFSRRGSALDR